MSENLLPTRVLITGRHFVFGTVKAGLLALDRNTLDICWKGSVGATMATFSPYGKPPQRYVGTTPMLAPDGSSLWTASFCFI